MSFTPSFGWLNRPDDVKRVLDEIAANGQEPLFSDAAPHLFVGDDNAPLFFWEAEQKILGQLQPSWNQGDAGTCTSFGWGRGCNDLLIWQATCDQSQEYPNALPSPEIIYGGSRYQCGGEHNSYDDGSVGAWCGQWVKNYGIVLRLVYSVNGQSIDLTNYNIERARDYGAHGCPQFLIPIAKEHSVNQIALVENANDVWIAVGSGKPVAICSNQGFTMSLNAGFSEASGHWNHCMLVRGRFTHPNKGQCFVIQNSWGDYLKGQDNNLEVEGKGIVQLPQGCFATTSDVMDTIASQQDSFALAGEVGWVRQKLDYTP